MRTKKSHNSDQKTYLNGFLLSTICLIILIIFIFLFSYSYYINETCLQIPKLEKKSMTHSLSSIVIGQKLAINLIVDSLLDYIERLKFSIYKPLVLSFHGGTGVGKSYLASLISKYLPKDTQVSTFSHTLHLKQSSSGAQMNEILAWIKGELSSCRWNVLILDNMDNTSEVIRKDIEDSLLDLKHFPLKAHLILIIISNLKAKQINEVVFKRMQNYNHNDLQIDDFEHIFQEDSLNSWFIQLYYKGLIDTFIPFVPLDKTNVLKCIELELRRQHKMPVREFVREISNEIIFYTLEEKGHQYSLSGCKKVPDKVALWVNTM